MKCPQKVRQKTFGGIFMKLSKCKYRKHSLSEKLEIVRLYETGMSSISLGKRFAIDERAVRRLLATYRTLGVSGLQKQTPNSNIDVLSSEI